MTTMVMIWDLIRYRKSLDGPRVLTVRPSPETCMHMPGYVNMQLLKSPNGNYIAAVQGTD